MPDRKQNFDNHVRFVPVYHYIAGPILLVNLVWAVWSLRAPVVPRPAGRAGGGSP